MTVPIFETERLLVRELGPADLPFVSEMLASPVTMRYWPRPYTTAEAEAWIERQVARYRDDGCGYWLLSLKDGQVPIGQVGVLRQELAVPPALAPPDVGSATWGLGYIVHHPFWGHGYATEAAAACARWALATLNPPFVLALVRPENTPSIAVAKRLKMESFGETEYAGFTHTVFALRRPD